MHKEGDKLQDVHEMDCPPGVHELQSGRISKLTPFKLVKLVIDILLAFVDMVIDLLLFYHLFIDVTRRDWVYLALGFKWFPGLVAIMYIICKLRARYPFKKVVLFSFFVLIMYPVVPIGAYMCFLYNVPRLRGQNDNHFKEAKVFVAAIRGITGCIEKPLQLIFQARLIINGIIDFDSSTLKDYLGNPVPIFVPLIISMSIAITSIFFSVFRLNLNCCEDDIDCSATSSSLNKILFPHKIIQVFDMAPYLFSNIVYRISSLFLMASLLNNLAFIPIFCSFLANSIVIILSKNYHSEKLLIVFMVLSCPIWLNDGKSKAIKLAQFRQLWFQSVLCFAFYGSSTLHIMYLINYSKTFRIDPNLIYDKSTITNFAILNICTGACSIFNAWIGKIKLSHVSCITKIVRLAVFSSVILCWIIFPLLGFLQTRPVHCDFEDKDCCKNLHAIWCNEQYPVHSRKVTCDFYEWMPEGQCSKSCDIGIQILARTKQLKVVDTSFRCDQEELKLEPCYTQSCPVPKVVLRCPTPQTDYYGIKFVWLRYEDAYADFCVSCRGSTVTCTKMPLTKDQLKTLKNKSFMSKYYEDSYRSLTYKVWNFLGIWCETIGFVKNVLSTTDILSGNICGENPTVNIEVIFN